MSNTPIITNTRTKIKDAFFVVSVIMGHTHTKSIRFLSANTRPIQSVLLHVSGVVGNKFQVLNSVIKPVTIDVVNDFSWLKVTSEMLLHNKTMLSYVTSPVFEGMVMGSDKSVSLYDDRAAFPPQTVLSRHDLSLELMTTFRRTGLSPSLAEFPSHYRELGTTDLASLGNVFHGYSKTHWDSINNRYQINN